MTPLRQLTTGSRARLISLGGDHGFRRRLMELGLLPGTELRVVRRVDTAQLVELECRGAHLSLRQSEANQLVVTPL